MSDSEWNTQDFFPYISIITAPQLVTNKIVVKAQEILEDVT